MCRRNDHAFTLIEMMIVVAIIGVLASAAIPAFLRYMQEAKNVEGLHNTQKVIDSARSYYEAKNKLPGGCSGTYCSGASPLSPVDGTAICVAGKEFHDPATMVTFNHPYWQALLFKPEGNIRFTYNSTNHIDITTPTSLYFMANCYRWLDCTGSAKWIAFTSYLGHNGSTVTKKGPVFRKGGF